MTEYFKIGKFVASHGLKGELILVHSLGKKTALKGLEALFIENGKDSFIPYFVENGNVRNETETLIKLEGYDSKESVRKLFPKEIWMRDEDFKKYAAAAAPIALLGFEMVFDEMSLGEIIEVIEQPHQVLCTIIYKGKEALIPIHSESLLKVDQDERRVYVNLPEGLLEIYE